MRKPKLKISTKLILLFSIIILFYTIITLITLSQIISKTNNSLQEKQMEKTIDGMSSYLEKIVLGLDLKGRLLASHEKVIEYTSTGQHNLLNRELVINWQSLDVDNISIFMGNISNLPSITYNSDKISVNKDHVSRMSNIGEDIVVNSLFIAKMNHSLNGESSSFITNGEDSLVLVSMSPIKKDKEIIAVLAIGILLNKSFMLSMENIFNSSIIFRSNNGVISSDDVDVNRIFGINRLGYEKDERIVTNDDYIIGTIPASQLGLGGGMIYSIYDKTMLKKQIRQYIIISIIISLITLVLALRVGFYFYRSTFIDPLQSLIVGIHKITSDNIAPPFINPGDDELGEVASSFNQMCLNLKIGEKEIHRLSLYNSLILENMKSGIVTLDLSGEIITVNPSAIEILTELSVPKLPKELKNLIDTMLENKNYVTGVALNVNTNGIDKDILLSTSEMVSYEGVDIGLIVVIEDVTRIRSLENQLIISSRLAALGEMIAGVAHQIRNPLAVMKVSMEMIRDDVLHTHSEPEVEELTGFMLKEIDTLDSVVNGFLVFARPNKMNNRLESVEDILDFTIRSILSSDYDGISLIKEIAPDAGFYFFDRNLMIQAISNLLINAFQCSEKGDCVTVRAFRGNNKLIIEIKDEGPGMTEEVLSQIYNPFFTTKDSGTGLGLSIVHRIVEDQNGKILLDSKLGEGTLFKLEFQEMS